MLTHAYLYSGADPYRDWVLEYLAAWEERTDRNGGVTPDNIGLSGEIGEYNDGKWWGGYYGWRWPHGAMTILEPAIIAGCNAVLLTGRFDCLKLARSQLDMLWSLRRKAADGTWHVPTRHYDDGWSDYRIPDPLFAVSLWNVSMQEEDAERAERVWPRELFDRLDNRYQSKWETNGYHGGFNMNTNQWFRYIRGKDTAYPANVLKMNYEVVRTQLERIRSDANDPHVRDHYDESMSIHQWQQLMPVILEGLAQLTLGGPMHLYHGGLQHARLRYYDAAAARPGLPPSVAALVEELTSDHAVVHVANLSLAETREVVVQAGTFGEHLFTAAETLDAVGSAANRTEVGAKWLLVRLAPGASVKLRLMMRRYVNRPSYETPWTDAGERLQPLHGRERELT